MVQCKVIKPYAVQSNKTRTVFGSANIQVLILKLPTGNKFEGVENVILTKTGQFLYDGVVNFGYLKENFKNTVSYCCCSSSLSLYHAYFEHQQHTTLKS